MRKLHLICNAHIDPIWQWTWDEGINNVKFTNEYAEQDDIFIKF